MSKTPTSLDCKQKLAGALSKYGVLAKKLQPSKPNSARRCGCLRFPLKA